MAAVDDEMDEAEVRGQRETETEGRRAARGEPFWHNKVIIMAVGGGGGVGKGREGGKGKK